MQYALFLVTAFALAQSEPLGPGDHRRSITVDNVKRRHWIHVPPKYDPKQPAAVVLALHGAVMTGDIADILTGMNTFTGLNKTADEHNFIVVYPNGTGPGGLFLTWNAGEFPGKKNNKSDDVKYLGKVLDDVENALNVNKKRIYVAGLSNGAMMAYRLAAEMSERIAAIAPVAGTLAVEKYEPKRPVPVIHFHGTLDLIVPFKGPDKKQDKLGLMRFRSVPDTILACVRANGCNEKATETEIDMKADTLKVTRKIYANRKNGADVVLYTVENGGHTWPGHNVAPLFLGLSTDNISANDVMWEFFTRHALK